MEGQRGSEERARLLEEQGLRFAQDMALEPREEPGGWYGAWISPQRADPEWVWCGSMWFPALDGELWIKSPFRTYTLYYGPGHVPIDIPTWYLTLELPAAGSSHLPRQGTAYYPAGGPPNSNFEYRQQDQRVHLLMGGTTERLTPAGVIYAR